MSNYNISNAEHEVLQVLWENDTGMLLSEILTKLNRKGKKWESSTIRTFLLRLENKKIISIMKRDRLNIYTPLISKKQFRDKNTNYLIRNFFEGNAKGLMASLLEENHITESDLDELKVMWDERKNKT